MSSANDPDASPAGQESEPQRASLIALLSRFSLMGILATATYLIVANILLLKTSLPPAWASVCAYLVGMCVSFLGQSRFTFQVERNTVAQGLRFVVLSGVGLLVSYGTVQWAETTGLVPTSVATIATAVIVPVLSFVVMKAWVFRPAD